MDSEHHVRIALDVMTMADKQDNLFGEQMLDEFLKKAFESQQRMWSEEQRWFENQLRAQQQFGWTREQMKQAYGMGGQAYYGVPPKPETPPKRKERETMSIRMPFGKHKGTPLVNLPTDYLDWVLGWMDSEESGWMSYSRKRLFDELDAEYERRKTGVRPTRAVKTALSVSPEAKALLSEFIKSGYRAMAMKCHPDKGGTPEQMIALKELKEALEKL